jgi:hypothetical protein
MMSFEEWINTRPHHEEVKLLFLSIEEKLKEYMQNVNRNRLFFLVARKVYEYSTMTSQYNYV